VGRRLRAGRGTNLALLALLGSALGTGALAFANGGRWAFAALAAHGAAGLGIVLLSPWKSAISRRGVRRGRPGTQASVVLAALVVVTVATGVVHAVGVWPSLLAMQIHVAAALCSIPLAIWHVIARPVRPRRTDLSRRSLLRAGAVAGGSVAAFGAIEGIVRATGLPGADRRATGSYERGSFAPAAMPVTQWLDDADPRIDADGWAPAVLMLTALGLHHDEIQVATTGCARPWTAGGFATQDWSGVRLDRLLQGVEDARSVVVTSATGYARRFPIDDANSFVLATRLGGGLIRRSRLRQARRTGQARFCGEGSSGSRRLDAVVAVAVPADPTVR
jgi:hypothetical protein